MSTIPNNRIFGQSDDPRKTELIRERCTPNLSRKNSLGETGKRTYGNRSGRFSNKFCTGPDNHPYAILDLAIADYSGQNEAVNWLESLTQPYLPPSPACQRARWSKPLTNCLHFSTRSADDDLDRAINTIKGL